jgi:hypothetical protein
VKLLFENWRHYLNEKRWADYDLDKGQWHEVPLEDIKTAADERGGEINLADELYQLIDTAYKSIGGHFKFKSASDLPSNYPEWLAVDIDDDPGPDALRTSRDTPGGKKIAASGHDGTRPAIDAYLAKTAELLNQTGYFGEMSKAIAHIMITRYKVPFVDNKETVEKALDKPVEWVGEHPEGKYPGYDGWYTREFTGAEAAEKKIMLGRPI